MKCKHCSHKNVEHAKFCSHCGKELSPSQGKIIRIIFLLILGIIAFAFLVRGNFLSFLLVSACMGLWLPWSESWLSLKLKNHIFQKKIFLFSIAFVLAIILVDNDDSSSEAQTVLDSYLDNMNHTTLDQNIARTNDQIQYTTGPLKELLILERDGSQTTKKIIIASKTLCESGILNASTCQQIESRNDDIRVVNVISTQVTSKSKELIKIQGTYIINNESINKTYLLRPVDGAWRIFNNEIDGILQVDNQLLLELRARNDNLLKLLNYSIILSNASNKDDIIQEESPPEVSVNESVANISSNSCIPHFLNETKCQSDAIMKEYQKSNCEVIWAFWSPCNGTCKPEECSS